MTSYSAKAFVTPTAASTAETSWRSAPHLPAVLDRLCLGVAVLNEHARVEFANRAFQAILANADRLVLRQGRIMATSTGDSVRLQAAISRCSKAFGSQALALDVPIWGPDSGAALIVSACSLDAGSAAQVARGPVMLFAVDTGPSSALDEKFLKSAFRLSDAEALVAMRLLEGATLAEIADAKGVSLHTARSQLKSVMMKVGVNRQSDLINLLSRCNVMQRKRHPGGEPRLQCSIPTLDTARVPVCPPRPAAEHTPNAPEALAPQVR